MKDLIYKTFEIPVFKFSFILSRSCNIEFFRDKFLFSLFLIFINLSLNAKEIELKIQDVTLYESSAGILRSGKIDLEPGMNEFVIRNLPIALQDESLVASVEAPGASVVGSSTWVETGSIIHNEEALELQKKYVLWKRKLKFTKATILILKI